MSEARVLVVDDEPIVREVLVRYLSKEGFEVGVAADGEQALIEFNRVRPDLVLLDLMLPVMDGFEVFRRIRASEATPVIMLTAKGDETDRVIGLETGADDYVTKPFSPREVVARVRAVLRRVGEAQPAEADVLEYEDGLRIDAHARQVVVGGVPARLTRMEFDLLYEMASSPGTAFSRAELLQRVWGFKWHGDTGTITVHVRRLREKIEAEPSRPRHLVTVRGVGYRFDP